MIRFITYKLCLLIISISQAQLVLQPIQPVEKPSNARIGHARVAQQVLTLPFWEDFSTSASVPDTNRWQSGPDVHINATLGQNPPTYKVATLDGLRWDGRAHDITNNFNGPGDSLVSQPIDLSLVDAFNRNSVYLSFYWQVGGFGEIPDVNDSLRLQFLMYNNETDSNEWVTKWAITGGPANQSEDFTQTIIQVDDERFFHENFRFKFQSFSSQRGPFDTWHLDYIYLNEGRGPNDLYYKDRSLSGSPTALFAPYHVIPARHFFKLDEQTISQQHLAATNLHNEDHSFTISYEIGNAQGIYFDHTSEGLTFGGYTLNRSVSGPANATINIPAGQEDSVLTLSSKFILNTTDEFLSGLGNINDTLVTDYKLEDYYAYDDGTAEFAAAINLLQGQVAMRFGLHQPDLVTHVDIYFPNIAPDATGKTVDIIVWSDLNENGERARQSLDIPAVSGLNQFTRVKLNQPVLATDTIYVGYQQFTDNYIGVGFDRNNAQAKGEIFTRTSADGWDQNDRLEGVLMIRPVFGSDTTAVLGNTPIGSAHFTVYPNPSGGVISIRGNHERIACYDVSGQLVYQSLFRKQYDLRFLQNGLYFLRIYSGDAVVTQKVVLAQ